MQNCGGTKLLSASDLVNFMGWASRTHLKVRYSNF